MPSHILLVDQKFPDGEELIGPGNHHNSNLNIGDKSKTIVNFEGFRVVLVLLLFLPLDELLVSVYVLLHGHHALVGGLGLVWL